MNSEDYETLKAAFKLIEAAGCEAISELNASEANNQASSQLQEHVTFLAALGNGVAQFTVWRQRRSTQSAAVANVTKH